MKKSGIIIAVIAVIVIAVVVIIVGSSKGPGTTTPTTQSEPITNVEISDTIRGVSGTITAIGKNTLTVDALILLKDTTKAPVSHAVKVAVTDSTTITKTVFPTAEEIANSKQPPQPTETKLTLSDLKIGDKIDVTATGIVSENIKSGSAVPAASISVIVK